MSSTDFVVTIHALERLEQRFPKLIAGLGDKEQADLVHEEVMEALDCRRYGIVPPIEIASRSPDRWITRTRDSYFCWTKDKTRGYLLKDDEEEGLLVLTVLIGVPREKAREKLWRKGSSRRR